MAHKHFTGQARAVAQVSSGAIASVDGTPADNTFHLTLGGVTVSAVGITSAAVTAAALVAAANASTHPYFAAVTWDVPSGGTVRGTADVAGVPFVATLTETGAGTGSVTAFSDTTPATGPHHWDNAANWSDGAVPIDTDTVEIAGSAVSICWGLDQSAVELAALVVKQTYTGRIGHHWPQFALSADGTSVDASAPEYRDTYLTIGFTSLDIGSHDGPQDPIGSGRLKIANDEAAASATVIRDTGAIGDDLNLPAVRLKFAHADADIEVRQAPGGVAIAADEPNETATVGTVTIAAESEATRVFIGDGCTLTALRQQGGHNVLRAAATVTTVDVLGGVLAIAGGHRVTTLTVTGGRVDLVNVPASGDVVTTLTIDGGLVDARGATAVRSVGTLNLDAGTLIADDEALSVTTFDQPAGLRRVTVDRL